MRLPKVLLITFLALLVTLLTAPHLLPRQRELEMARVIPAGRDALYAAVAAPRAWLSWNQSLRSKDPAAFTFTGPESGPGAVARYEADGKHVRFEVREADVERGVAYDLDLDEGTYRAAGVLVLEPLDQATRVTWRLRLSLGDDYFAPLVLRFLAPRVQDEMEQDLDALARAVTDPTGGPGLKER